MTARPDDPALRRRRHEARVALLKRRLGLASALGFATLFGLAAQHSVGAGAKRAPARSTSGAVPQTRTLAAASFFDASGDGYTFNDGGASASSAPASAAGSSQASQPQPQPTPAPAVAQTSVS